MINYQVNASIPTAEPLVSKQSFSCGPDAPGVPTAYSRVLGMGAGGGRAAFRQNRMRKFPSIQPLSKRENNRAFLSSCVAKGTPNLIKDGKLEPEEIDQENDEFGRHFLFDKTCPTLGRTRTLIPPLSRDFSMHRSANLHPFRLSEELSHGRVGRPFTLSYPRGFEVDTSPTFFLPSTLVLNGRNIFSEESCKLSRPTVKYPTYNAVTVKDNQKTPSYPDPVVGASRSFIHRINELSSLEYETVRQEKLKKMRKSRKAPS